MDPYENVKLHITHHAYKRYVERVESVNLEELTEQCQEDLKNKQYGYNKGKFIHLNGVWWTFLIEENVMSFITCYGKTTMHIPKGLKWAEKHNDRLGLSFGTEWMVQQ